MAKRVRPAATWQRADDQTRRIAATGKVLLKAHIKAVLAKLSDLVPKRADRYARAGDWHGVVQHLDWNHFRQVMRAPAGQINKIREAAAQAGALQINARHASAGRPVRFRKYSPSQPRDARGRWVAAGTSSTANLNVSGKNVLVSLSRQSQAGGDRLVNVNVHRLNAAWSKDAGFYVGPSGAGAGIGGRYERFGQWLLGHDHMEASEVGVMPDGAVGFTNGRHRFAWLRDQGIDTVPVAMDKESRANAKKHGYLSTDVLKFYRGVPGIFEELLVDGFMRDIAKLAPVSTLDELFAKTAGDDFAFDLYTDDLQEQLREAQDQLIAELEQGVRDTIEQIVLNGARMGLTPDQIMGDVRQLVGLTENQAQAVLNYRNMLESLDGDALDRQLRNFLEDDTVQEALDSGQPMDAAMVDKLVQDYTDNYLDYRAETIAQTESVRAANYGLQDAYEQAIDRGVFPSDAVKQYWRIALDEKTCEVCLSVADLNPNGRAMGEDFDSIDGPQDSPPAHPNCRCSVEIVTDLDQVDTSGDEEAA